MVRLIKEFRLDEISAVDYPAQEGARALIMKRREAPLNKAAMIGYVVSKMAKAIDFDDARTIAESCEDLRPYTNELYEYWWSLQSAIDSINSDLNVADKKAAIQESVAQFSSAVNGLFNPNKEADVADIAEITKRAEAAEAQVVELTKRSDELAKKLEVAEVLAKRADDEILKVGETEIRKSAVGAEMFAFAKAQDAALTKARDDAELATLAKRASTEFGALPGTDLAKAKILKAAASMPEDVAEALTEALAAGNAAMKLGFEKAGMVGGAPTGSAQDEINTLAKTRAAKDGISFAKASVLVMDENPELYKRADAEHAARVKGV